MCYYCSPEIEISPEPESRSQRNLRLHSPNYFGKLLKNKEASIDEIKHILHSDDSEISDKPESDQHFNFPIIRVHSPEDDEDDGEECDNHLEIAVDDTSTLSHQTSLESDAFYSDLVFSETPSPVSFNQKHRSEDWM